MSGTDFLPHATSALQTLLAVSILMAIVLVARRPVAKHFGAGIAYALWAFPVARLFLPPLQMPVSLMPLLRLPTSGAHEPADAAYFVTLAATASEGAGPAVPVAPSAHVIARPAPLPDMIPDGVASPESLTDILFAILLPGLFILWAGGALFFFGLSLWRQHAFMQTVKREAVAVSPHMQRIARDIGRQVGLKRLPVIASSFISSGPLVTGLARPVVLVPAWFETDYDDVQQRAALAHELTHVRRGDLWALQLAELFVACLWFNPLAHYAHRAFRTDQEAACDADVLKTGTATPHAYGTTLIKAVKSASQERLPAAASLPLTHALKERLSRMRHPTPTPTRRLIGGAAATVLGAAALLATSSVTASAAEPDKPERTQKSTTTVMIDGKELKDRQIVVLGKPFEDTELPPEAQAEIDRLSAEMSADGARIGEMAAGAAAEAAIFALTPEDTQELNDILAEVGDMPVMDELPQILSMAFVSSQDMTDEEREALEAEMDARSDAFEARMEAWGERFGARMGAWGEKVGARAETWAASFDPKIEIRTDELEARIEAKAGELERLIDEHFGQDFETRIEARASAIGEMSEQCRDIDLADGEARVFTRNVEPGVDVKIVCVKGDRSALRSARILTKINSDKSLSAEEKQSFRERVGEDTELAGSDN